MDGWIDVCMFKTQCTSLSLSLRSLAWTNKCTFHCLCMCVCQTDLTETLTLTVWTAGQEGAPRDTTVRLSLSLSLFWQLHASHGKYSCAFSNDYKWWWTKSHQETHLSPCVSSRFSRTLHDRDVKGQTLNLVNINHVDCWGRKRRDTHTRDNK